jgi:prepilin-type N-terminal cleavage/methylation domain-containing protein
MSHPGLPEKCGLGGRQRGFSLLELMAALALLLLVSGIIMSALKQMMMTQGTISNRTEMHSSVRSATEVLQQEIGQAGRVSLPAPVTLTSAVTATGIATVGVSSAAGMFIGEQLLIGAGATQETVALTAVVPATNQITGQFDSTHAIGAPVMVAGAFASGIVPTSGAPANFTNGSTSTLLKLYGDINGDGNMVYVEYKCDTAGGNLYRNVMPFTAAIKPGLTSAQVLLPNILANPGGTPCFSYQEKQVGADWYIVDVAVTLTVQTQNPDPQTNQFQTETKALLNVSPRNVFEGWQLASGGVTNRVQPMPASVTALLP